MKIGNLIYNEEGVIETIERGETDQGMVYKNYDAFFKSLGELQAHKDYKSFVSSLEELQAHKDYHAFITQSNDVCYIPEVSDNGYNFKDFLDIAGGNLEIAKILFDLVDWQSPESLYNDLLFEEIRECKKCNNRPYQVKGKSKVPCPICGIIND